MPHNLEDRHLVEIDHTSILEPIDEVFDSITSLLTGNAVMYGSTVTSILAGLPIKGDLDIAVSNHEHRKLVQRLADSVKWLQVEGSRVPETGEGGYRLSRESTPSSGAYKNAEHLPISNVITFETTSSARVQIMESKARTGDPLEDALDVVRKVDFAFCGMALDKWGRLLETIPHGYYDCQNRFIRIVDYQPRLDPVRLKARILKYTHRGWHLTFAIDQALLNLKRAKLAASKIVKKKKKPRRPSKASLFRVKKDQGHGVIIELKPDVVHIVGSRDKCRDVIRHFGRDAGVVLDVSSGSKLGGMQFYARDGKLNLVKAREIILGSSSYMKRNFGVTPEKVEEKKKQNRLEGLYGSSGPPYKPYGSQPTAFGEKSVKYGYSKPKTKKYSSGGYATAGLKSSFTSTGRISTTNSSSDNN